VHIEHDSMVEVVHNLVEAEYIGAEEGSCSLTDADRRFVDWDLNGLAHKDCSSFAQKHKDCVAAFLEEADLELDMREDIHLQMELVVR